jgi:hypothetical protein
MPKRQSTLEGRARTAKARAVLAARLPPGPRRNARPRRPPGWPASPARTVGRASDPAGADSWGQAQAAGRPTAQPDPRIGRVRSGPHRPTGAGPATDRMGVPGNPRPYR